MESEVCITIFENFAVLEYSTYIPGKEQFLLDLMQIYLYSTQIQALKLLQGPTTLD